MKYSRRLLWPILLAGLSTPLFLPNVCRADLPKDEDIRKFIQDVAAQDKDSACKDLGITADNTEGVSQVNDGIKTVGRKKVDDITRTNFQYDWTNGIETLDATYHIRAGDAGFYLLLELQSKDKKLSSVDLSFEKAEANPVEVRVINFTIRHWALLLFGSLLALALLIIGAVWMIRRFSDKPSIPPKIPVG